MAVQLEGISHGLPRPWTLIGEEARRALPRRLGGDPGSSRLIRPQLRSRQMQVATLSRSR
jgi:hypothetical protein